MAPILQFGLEDSPKPPRTPKSKAANKGLEGAIMRRNTIKREDAEDNESCSPSPSPSKRIKKDPARPRLIIGIDFGTTYSAGVAIVHSEGGPADIEVIKQWPGNFEVRDKVPSTIADSIDESESRLWGYEVPVGLPCSSWFKLRMAPSNTSAIQDDPLLLQSVGPGLLRIPEGETPAMLCKEYLHRLYKHVLTKIGREYTKSMLDTLRAEVVLTTPADWNMEYKASLRQAARAAGVASRVGDSISTIDEPEAAALAAFEASRKQGNLGIFKLNTNVVVVDIGGGTIDIITYTITRKTPLKIREACRGAGAKCGATTIDRELHKLMESKYGTAFSSLQVKETGHGSQFMELFESVKRWFKGHGEGYDKEYKIPLLMDIEDGAGEEIVQMFDKVVMRAFEMIREQISRVAETNNNPVNLIVLCGGMADSGYVQKRFDQFCAEDLKGEAETIVPRDSWSAIARGAVLHALKPSMVESRKSRWSYGLGIHRAFDPECDSGEQHRFKCPARGPRVKGCIQWFIRRDDTVQEKVKWIHGYIAMKKNGRARDTVGDILLYRSQNPTPGDRVNDPDVEQFAKLSITIPFQSFEADKKLMIGHKIDVNEKTVEFEAKCGRKIIGKMEVDYKEADK
ncbi:hypothetical protein EMCG_09694 [[Emmonsia] crescens]|uniref:Hsp70-like protein n=1 Tax=[Emmonsia] crescens TaxID=73230 RepID=A0A0G2I2B9_9EURO|nr:hypothetical protein EMCG_09694 [Emmonsia crescens UAMH 3008]